MLAGLPYTAALTQALTNVSTGTLAFLFGSFRLCFKGGATIMLPSTAGGAATNYTNSAIHVTAAFNGSQNVVVDSTGTCLNCYPTPASSNQYDLRVVATDPQRVAVNVFGCFWRASDLRP